LSKTSKLTEDLKQSENLDSKDEDLIEKLNDFIVLLAQSKLDSKKVGLLKTKFNQAIDRKLSDKSIITEIQNISEFEDDKLAQLDKLELLLNNNYLDSKRKNSSGLREKLIGIMKSIIGFLFVTLGFAMIIMPAPPYFEMFTIFYFTANDGVTLMDLISLIIIAVGFYIVLKSLINPKNA
jgi:hypothetical protein